jgi:mRNA interferase MazF
MDRLTDIVESTRLPLLSVRPPVPVLQSSPFKASRIATVVVAVITSNLSLAMAPRNARLGKSESGLSNPSVLNVNQVSTIDRALLGKRVQALPGDAMGEVDAGLGLVLGL